MNQQQVSRLTALQREGLAEGQLRRREAPYDAQRTKLTVADRVFFSKSTTGNPRRGAGWPRIFLRNGNQPDG
jgi:hypothetical protein